MSDADTTLMTDDVTTSPPRRLERDPEQRIIAGVATGLGNRFQMNPWWFRWGFILLALFGGLGLALYAVGWLLIPERGHSDPLAVEMMRRVDGRDASTWIGIALVVVAGLIVIGWIGWLDSALFWATALVVLGVLLYQGDIRISGPPQEPAPPPGGAAEETAEDQQAEEPPAGGDAGGEEPPAELSGVAAAPVPAAPPKKRSITGPVTFGATLVVLGAMAFADVVGWTNPSFADYVAAALAVFGVGLLAGAWWGKSVAVIIVGVLLLPVLFFARFVPVDFSGDFGDVRFAPAVLADVQPVYELQAGEFVLDLTDVDFAGATRQVEVNVGAGDVVIRLPAGTGLEVDAAVGIGELSLLGNRSAGFALTRVETRSGPGLLFVDANLGAGSLRISQEG